MALTSIGDMARHFIGLRDMNALRQNLARSAAEVGSRRVADPVRHLQGRGDRLVALDHQMSALRAEQGVALALGNRLQAAQAALTALAARRGDLSTAFLATPAAITPQALAQSGAEAEGALRDLVAALGTRHGGEFLFSGRKSDRAPLPAADTILSALRAQAASAGSLADLALIARQMFEDPAGDFATTFYQGASGPPETRQIASGVAVEMGPRADDPALRRLLTAYATALLVSETELPATAAARAGALQQVGQDLVGAAGGLTALASGLGAGEAALSRIATARGAGLTAAGLMRQELVGIDEAAAISRLQELQAQLEIQYTLTARLAGLSLAGYLR